MVLNAHRISDSSNQSFVVKASVDGWVGVSEVAWVTSVFSARLFFSGWLEEPLSAELVEGTAWEKV